ncbi:MAG: hypothetical protein OEY19_03355 [Gammaproteobacteria bacterium]|nr:hypothetical protein [Gammaproteobacteria bacterium]MDH5630796.1 hypothetical protein [Gammaproteobacteria bacterium]
MKAKIKDWLIRTGYPLELFVYEYFLKKKYLCDKSSIYSDIESGTKREIDVTAYQHGPSFEACSYSLQLLIECKKSDKPLLVLAEDKSSERYEQFFGNDVFVDLSLPGLFAYSHLKEQTKAERRKNIGLFSDSVPLGYSIIPAFEKSDNKIYKGIMGLTKANEYYRSEHKVFFDSIRSKEIPEIDFLLLMPLLVIDAPLYTVSIDNDGELQVTETDWASLTVHLPWNLGKSDSERKCNIQVIKKEKLDDVVCSIENLLHYISSEEFSLRAVKCLIKEDNAT